MRKFTLSTVLTVIFLGGAMAGAGVVGTYGIVAPLLAGDPSPTIAQNGVTSHVSIDGRVPVRLKTVVEGRFRPAETGTVTFVRSGRKVQEAMVLEGGTVQAETLSAGPYSVFVHGEGGYAAFSTWLAPSTADGEAAGAILSVGLVPSGDMPIVRRIVSNHQSTPSQGLPQVREPGNAVAQEVSRTSRNLVHSSEFEISPDGMLRGRVLRNPGPDDATPFSGASVYFVHSNRIVAQTITTADGLFELPELSTGVYSLVVAGEGSFLAMSVEVVPTLPTVASSAIINEISFASLQDGPPIPEISPVHSGDVVVVEEYWMGGDQFAHGVDACSDCYAGGAGGFGGGGGGAAGGGGFAGGHGGLLGALAIGGLAVGIVALADDDDSRIIISPANP